MATLSANNLTLLDHAKRTDPDGSQAVIVEAMSATNDIVGDAVYVECNDGTSHKTTVRTGLPNGTWRKMYGYVQPTKSTTAQVKDSCGMLEAYSVQDEALVDMAKDPKAFRMSESVPHFEGMGQQIASTFFYGDETTNPERFTGLSPRYNSLSAENADNIIVGGGAGADNGSIWLVVWGDNTVHGILPQNSKAGITSKDQGVVTQVDSSGGKFEAYQSHFRADTGLSVKDWRYCVRIPNIDKSLLSTTWTSGAFSSGADLSELMFQAIDLIPNLGMGKPSFYMSRTMRTTLRQQLAAKTQGSTLSIENVGGKRVQFFDEIPIGRCDALAADEALVS